MQRSKLSFFKIELLVLALTCVPALLSCSAKGDPIGLEGKLTVNLVCDTQELLPLQPLHLLLTISNPSPNEMVEITSSWEIVSSFKFEGDKQANGRIYHSDRAPMYSPLAPRPMRFEPGETKRLFITLAYDTSGCVFRKPGSYEVSVTYGSLRAPSVSVQVLKTGAENEYNALTESEIPRFFCPESAANAKSEDVDQRIDSFLQAYPSSAYAPLVKIGRDLAIQKQGVAGKANIAYAALAEVGQRKDVLGARAQLYLADCYKAFGETASQQTTLKKLSTFTNFPVQNIHANSILKEIGVRNQAP